MILITFMNLKSKSVKNDTLITYTVAHSAKEERGTKINFTNVCVVALKTVRNYDFQRNWIKGNTSEIHCSLYRARFPCF